MAVWGGLKPINNERMSPVSNLNTDTPLGEMSCTNAPMCRETSASDGERLTESDFFVESNATGGLFGKHFLRGKEDAILLLEGLFSLNISHLW